MVLVFWWFMDVYDSDMDTNEGCHQDHRFPFRFTVMPPHPWTEPNRQKSIIAKPVTPPVGKNPLTDGPNQHTMMAHVTASVLETNASRDWNFSSIPEAKINMILNHSPYAHAHRLQAGCLLWSLWFTFSRQDLTKEPLKGKTEGI